MRNNQHQDLFLIFGDVRLRDFVEGEVSGGVDPERVVDGVALLVLRHDERIDGRAPRVLHQFAQVVRTVDADPVPVRGRVVCANKNTCNNETFPSLRRSWCFEHLPTQNSFVTSSSSLALLVFTFPCHFPKSDDWCPPPSWPLRPTPA